MGFYDDDGVYHRDAYDDDHLDLQDIGKFCEKRLYDENGKFRYRSRYRRNKERIERYYAEMPPEEARAQQEARMSFSSLIGTLIGAVIGFCITRVFGTVLLIAAAAALGSGIGGVFHRRVVEEVHLTPKEMVQFFFRQYGTYTAVTLLFADIILYFCK